MVLRDEQMWERRQQSWDFLKSSLKEHIMYLDFPVLPSVCHFSYYFGSITQFILFIDEIFAWPFDNKVQAKTLHERLSETLSTVISSYYTDGSGINQKVGAAAV